MNIDNMSESDIKLKEAEIAARRSEVTPVYQHYGSFDSMSDSDIRLKEAEVAARRSEITPTYQHYGSVENMNDSDRRIIEAQVAEKRELDIPHKEYFKSLLSNPTIHDFSKFEAAVNRSMESNGIMKEFASGLVEEISKASYGFKTIDKTDSASIEQQRQRIENLVNVYVTYLYTLKNKGWSFNDYGSDIGLEKVDSDTLDTLRKVQRDFEITIKMPIPHDMGEYYGKAFERQGKMIPGFTLMYDDLKNKEVNWHQVMIYRENELTPRERYLQRRQEVVQKFALARQEEIQKTLKYAQAVQATLMTQNGTITPNPEMVEETSVSIRR